MPFPSRDSRAALYLEKTSQKRAEHTKRTREIKRESRDNVKVNSGISPDFAIPRERERERRFKYSQQKKRIKSENMYQQVRIKILVVRVKRKNLHVLHPFAQFFKLGN